MCQAILRQTSLISKPYSGTDADVSPRSTPLVASHAGNFRAARISSLPTNGGIDVSRNVPQRRWAIRNVCFRRLIPGKTDWSYLPLLADRMREVFSRREASWKWSSVQGLQNNGLLASNKFKADVLSSIFSFFTRKLISLVRVMVKITRTLYVTYSTSVQTQDRWKSPVTRKTTGTASEFLPQIPYHLQSVSVLHEGC